MYYAIFDKQNNGILAVGLNCKNLKKLRDCLVTFLLDGSFSEEGEESILKNTLIELCNYYEFKVLSSNKFFILR
jgi:hypothetical protein